MPLPPLIPPSIHTTPNKENSRHRPGNGHNDDDHFHNLHRVGCNELLELNLLLIRR